MRLRGLAEATFVVLAALALTVALTYPLAFKLGHVGRINTDDGRWSIWVVSWVAHALTTEPLGVFHANIFYPERNTLAFSEANLVAGAIGAPVWAVTHNPYTTHNVVVLVSFVVAAAGAYYLVRYLTGHRGAAAVAAVLFAFCPFAFARLPHIQLLMIGGLPFCLLAFHRLVDQPTVTRSSTLGIVLWIQALACAYYGIFATLMIGFGTLVHAVTRRRWRDRDYWLAIALAAFVSIGLTTPFFLPYLRVQRETGFARTLDDAQWYSADGGAWLASSAPMHQWWMPDSFNEVLFPGILATVLGIGGIVVACRDRDRRELLAFYGLASIFAFWLSFGPNAGLYALLHNTIPVFSYLRAPGRIGILVTLCLVVFAGYLLSVLMAGRRRGVSAAALVLLAVFELNQAPLRGLREIPPLPAAYRTLSLVPPGVVIEFPYFHQRHDFPRHAIYMLNSTSHFLPMVNGYSDNIPQRFRRQALTLSTFPSRDACRILRDTGVRYVLFHFNLLDSRSRERVMGGLTTYGAHLRPLHREGDVWLFEIVSFPN